MVYSVFYFGLFTSKTVKLPVLSLNNEYMIVDVHILNIKGHIIAIENNKIFS